MQKLCSRRKGDVFQSDITLLSFDNGEVINRCVIEEPIVFTISACAINDNLIAVSRDEGYWIIDAFTGKIISKKEVEDNGGEVKLISFVEGKSTTNIINRIHEIN